MRASPQKLERVARLAGAARYPAYEALSVELARDAAPWVVFATGTAHDLFSARLGCQMFHPSTASTPVVCSSASEALAQPVAAASPSRQAAHARWRCWQRQQRLCITGASRGRPLAAFRAIADPYEAPG